MFVGDLESSLFRWFLEQERGGLQQDQAEVQAGLPPALFGAYPAELEVCGVQGAREFECTTPDKLKLN